MEQRIFKSETEFDLPKDGLAELGKHVSNETTLYKTFIIWQKQRKEKIMSELLSLSTNPTVNERIIGIMLGKIKAMEDDLTQLFKLSVKVNEAKDKAKKEKEA